MRRTILFLLLNTITIMTQDKCLRFFGNGVNDIDRVKILISNQNQPVNLANSFTIEFELKAVLSENPLGSSATQGANDDWTLGHIIIDRDIFGSGDYGDYGISLVNGRVAFGINNGSQSFTIITSSQIPNNQWVHIAATRNHINGQMRIFVNGVQSANGTGPTGNISYRVGRSTVWANDPYIVFGAEKHDYDPNSYPSFRGFIDNVRFSNIVRYTTNFTPSSYSVDGNTVAFYNFNSDGSNIVYDLSSQPSNGVRNYGGTPSGPVYVDKNDSVFAVQGTSNSLNPGTNNNPIICLYYLKSDYNQTVNVQSITFTTDGTSNTNDITAARVYYTTSPVFSTNIQFGSNVLNPSGTFTISGNQQLVNGSNYFWLVYDIASNANTNNNIDATCTAVTINQPPYNVVPSITDPEGIIPLPIELISFDYKIVEGRVNLYWETASEVNTLGFQVERKNISKFNLTEQWESLSFINSKGNSNKGQSYKFTDNHLSAGEYLYRIIMIDIDGSYSYSDELFVKLGNPSKTLLKQNYPNAFNPQTVIEFQIKEKSNVKIEIFDINGNLVHIMLNKTLEAGYYSEVFNISYLDNPISSGVYFIRLIANEISSNQVIIDTKKMMLLK